jgi:hypothetical protein
MLPVEVLAKKNPEYQTQKCHLQYLRPFKCDIPRLSLRMGPDMNNGFSLKL